MSVSCAHEVRAKPQPPRLKARPCSVPILTVQFPLTIMPSMVEAKDIVINGGIFHQNIHPDSKSGMGWRLTLSAIVLRPSHQQISRNSMNMSLKTCSITHKSGQKR